MGSGCHKGLDLRMGSGAFLAAAELLAARGLSLLCSIGVLMLVYVSGMVSEAMTKAGSGADLGSGSS